MENVVPSVLQRLRAADIIRVAGLVTATRGQEYCRLGVVHNTQRQGARLSGTVDGVHASTPSSSLRGDESGSPRESTSYPVSVEIESATTWSSTCPCSPNTVTPCVHSAALLYQWLARPTMFLSSDSSVEPPLQLRQPEPVRKASEADSAPFHASSPPKLPLQGPTPLTNLMDILMQLGLSELRGMAREYELSTNGMNKQQLAETIIAALQQSEAVRRVAATLEKPHRQLLAALTLAGGSVTDEDLRGLFERFSLGHPHQLQGILTTLQNKALLFRTSLNSSAQVRIGLGGALLDIGWHVPAEVRAALRVTVPVTNFALQQADEHGHLPTVHSAQSGQLLADLLLVARALDGYRLDGEGERESPSHRAPSTSSPTRSLTSLSSDGSIALPHPTDLASATLLATLHESVPRSTPLLRFAFHLLRLADILHKDDTGTPYLRLLPNAAHLLLGTAQTDVIRDLFELWLTHSSYEDLFALQDYGVRLRCRASALNLPLLRSGELDAENSEARQSLLALLGQAPLKQWISFPAFARFVYRLNPLFLQRRQRTFPSPHWWLEREERRPLRPLQLSDWLRGDLYYLEHLLSGPLHWWGVCDIAHADDGQLLAFRLTPLAGWLWGHAPQEEELQEQHSVPPTQILEVVDAQEILVMCSSDAWPLLSIVETFMEAAGVQHERLRYRLTPKALGTALSRGHRPTRLLELLETLLAPEEDRQQESLRQMIAQVERWVTSYGHARLYTGVTLLEVADTAVMRELMATTSLEKQVVQPIHPTLLILNTLGPQRLTEELKRRGQPPLLHDEEEFYGAE